MGFLDRFRRRERHIVTPRQLGFKLMSMAADSAFEGPESLDTHIRRSGPHMGTAPWEYTAELLIFAAFPYDVMVMTQFGEQAWLVRAALVEGLGEFLKTGLRSPWPDQIDWQEWPERVQARFLEYAEAVERASGSQSGRVLGLRAAERVSGTADLEIAMHLAVYFSTTLAHLREPLGEYELGPA